MTLRALAASCLFLLWTESAAAKVVISTMGTDISVEDASSGASLHSMGGDIRVGQANGNVVAKTMGGLIEVRELRGNLQAGSMGGNIRVRITGSSGNQEIELHTMGGTVELTVPRNFDATFHIEIEESRSNDPAIIESDFPLTKTTTEHWSLWNGRRRTNTWTKTQSTQPNRVDIVTYGSRVSIHRE